MLKSAWRHRREDHSCEEISPCPYRGETLLEKRRFSNVNQIDEEFDPNLDDDEDPDITEDRQVEDLAEVPENTEDEEDQATAETEHSGRELNCCCVIS